ncbi:hypothetical protein BDW75DRAFT_238501 [Aspergillus navahoensis]
MAARSVIEYYFSLISLWSYIGRRRFQRLIQATNAHTIRKPIDLLYIYSAPGGVSLCSNGRRNARPTDRSRWNDVPYSRYPQCSTSTAYPADPSLAHRVLLAAIEELGNDSPAVQEITGIGSGAVWAEMQRSQEVSSIEDRHFGGLHTRE